MVPVLLRHFSSICKTETLVRKCLEYLRKFTFTEMRNFFFFFEFITGLVENNNKHRRPKPLTSPFVDLRIIRDLLRKKKRKGHL